MGIFFCRTVDMSLHQRRKFDSPLSKSTPKKQKQSSEPSTPERPPQEKDRNKRNLNDANKRSPFSPGKKRGNLANNLSPYQKTLDPIILHQDMPLNGSDLT